MKSRRRCTKQASFSAVGRFPSSSDFSVGHCTRTDRSFPFFVVLPMRKGWERRRKTHYGPSMCPGTRPFGMDMPLMRDCPMGPFERHLGVEGHVKFTVRTGNFGRDSRRRGKHTGLMTFKGRNE
ncbi:hypothetical protein EVAR_14938_1 [Eumeta japonica]|uniref:Uncharacterized protein n=1 Tax=Eumeta variegata TaxID=151549 RepID=A0A4C1XQB1_EUMVA|nr:hypothetical protein EVAR_14938_1 [Eumeta japonica]